MGISRKVSLITGADQGIGRAIVDKPDRTLVVHTGCLMHEQVDDNDQKAGSASHERVPGRGRLCIQERTSDANHAIRPGPMRRRAGNRLRATYR